jgi:hypothetical protein
MLGSVTQVVLDDNGQSHTMYWDVPTQVIIAVQVTITKNSSWVAGNTTLVTTAVVKTIGGVDTVSGIYTQYPGLGTGINVLAWEIEAALGSIGGIDDVSVLIAAYPTTPNARKVAITTTQYAWCQDGYITVTAS